MAEVVGSALAVMMTSSAPLVQEPSPMVHLKVAENPIRSPVTPDVAELISVIVAVPAIRVHVPIPDGGGSAASVAVVIPQTV